MGSMLRQQRSILCQLCFVISFIIKNMVKSIKEILECQKCVYTMTLIRF